MNCLNLIVRIAFRNSRFNNKEDTIYIGAGDVLYAVDTNGNLVWQNSTDVKYLRDTITVDSNGVIYCASYRIDAASRRVFAINPDGSLKWFYSFGVIETDIIYDFSLDSNNTLYFKRLDSADSNKTTLYALNTSDGSLKWTKYLGNTWDYYKPVVIDSNNRLYHMITIAGVRTYVSWDADGNTRWLIRGTGTGANVTGGIIDEKGWYYLTKDVV